MNTLKVFDYDFNRPNGSIIIDKDSPDFDRPEYIPVVGETIILVCLESRSFKWDDDYNDTVKNWYDSGFGALVEVTDVKLSKYDPQYYLVETNYYEQMYENK